MRMPIAEPSTDPRPRATQASPLRRRMYAVILTGGPMPRAAECFALHTANPADRIALRGVRLRARLSGMSQRTTIEQTFVNAEPHAIEAVYTFPLPESAAVCGFEVVTGNRVLTGKIEESEQAIEQYEAAVDEG